MQSTPVPRFSTVATGFWIAQLGLYNPRIEDSVIFANTAPRNVDDTADNRGREFVRAELENGMEVFTVNSGYCLSFVKDSIEDLRKVEAPREGSQFRSRDFFPEATAKVVNNGEKLGDELDEERIPEVPESAVGFVDGYGNIKTTIRSSEIKLEEDHRVEVEIGESRCTAYLEHNSFEVPEGELSVAPGSSGGEDPFIEIFLRGGSAAERLDDPQPGDRVKIIR